MTEPFDFDAGVKALAIARQNLAETKKAMLPFEIRMKTARDTEKNLDELVREKALEEYGDGVKKPHPAITIKLTKKRNWNTQANRIKAIVRDPERLSVDNEQLERVAHYFFQMLHDALEGDTAAALEVCKTLSETLALDTKNFGEPYWATPIETEVPVVNIATKLGHYLIVGGEYGENSEERDQV